MKQAKKFLALLLTAGMLCVASACGTDGSDSVKVNDEAAATAKPTEDRTGAKITVPDEVDEIAVLAPSITETLIDLGCADDIVAIDTQTQMYAYQEISSKLPAFDMMAPDTEQLAALKPDVVFISGITDVGGTDLYADLKELGICVINVPSPNDMEGVKEDIAFIAACVGKTEEGSRIVKDMEAEIEKIAETGKTITDKKSVYFEISAAPYCYSFGNETFLNEMIELIGAENILAEQTGWLSVEMESVIAENPDVILTNVNYMEKPTEEILAREGWDGVTAVKNGDVYYIDNRSSSLPNENIVKALKEMASAVYPDYYEK